MHRRINIPLPSEVHTALRMYCVRRGKTMAAVIVEALEGLLSVDDEQKPPKRRDPSV